MSTISTIQWCDTTVNPIMGCAGCELFTAAPVILRALDAALVGVCDWPTGTANVILSRLCSETYDAIPNPHPAMQRHVTTTNIWHLRQAFAEAVIKEHGPEAGEVAKRIIEEQVTCYAAKLHLNKGASLVNPTKVPHKGHAPVFSMIHIGEDYHTRVPDVAKLKDLLGTRNERTPWKDDLPRMVFVSDMGDAFSRKQEFEYLKTAAMEPITSEKGKRHLWLWVTKRPHIMKEFAEQIGGFPANVCAMTTLTSPNAENLKRLADLKQVPAAIRGLSIEPLWERIPLELLDLSGIHWVIVGAESGSPYAREFPVEWAEELRDHCRANGVAFFCKQLGRKPTYKGQPVKLADSHGGEWDEWLQYPWGEALRVREFPRQFHEYRKDEKTNRGLRPVHIPPSEKKKLKEVTEPDLPSKEPSLTPEQIHRFEALNKVVQKVCKGVIEAALAMAEIQRDRLYRAQFKTFKEYCDSVKGFSRQYGARLAAAGRVYQQMTTQVVKMGFKPDAIPLPTNEAQLTVLAKIKDDGEKVRIFQKAVQEVGGDPDKLSSTQLKAKIIQASEPKAAPIASRRLSPNERLRKAHALLGQLKQQVEPGAEASETLKALEEMLTPESSATPKSLPATPQPAKKEIHPATDRITVEESKPETHPAAPQDPQDIHAGPQKRRESSIQPFQTPTQETNPESPQPPSAPLEDSGLNPRQPTDQTHQQAA
jgi:protein gp37